MAVQLPYEVLGTAVGVLVYSVAALLGSVSLFVMVWVHHERTSYVAGLSAATSLSTSASIAQQVHTLVLWRDIKVAQFRRQVYEIGNPELSVAGSSEGLDLVLFYIQYYCYNVEALLTLSWAVELTASVFYFTRLKFRNGSLVAKSTAIILPAVQTVLLRSSAVQDAYVAYYVVANAIMAASLTLGALLLLIILVKYVHTQTSLLSWHVQYADLSALTGGSSQSSGGRLSPVLPRRSIYDNWVIVRFTIAFAAISAFELLSIMFEVNSAKSNSIAHLATEPDLSIARAQLDFLLFMPGVSASILVFVVFGTTKTFLDYMWTKLAPRPIRAKLKRVADSTSSSTVAAAAVPPGQQRTTSFPWRESGEDGVPRLPPIPLGGDDDFRLDSFDFQRIGSGMTPDPSDEQPILKAKRSWV